MEKARHFLSFENKRFVLVQGLIKQPAGFQYFSEPLRLFTQEKV